MLSYFGNMLDSSRFERNKLKREGHSQDCKIKLISKRFFPIIVNLHRFDGDPHPDPDRCPRFMHVAMQSQKNLDFFKIHSIILVRVVSITILQYLLFFYSRLSCKFHNFAIGTLDSI
jgi:hypothetical protein